MNRQAKRFATIVAFPSGRLTGGYVAHYRSLKFAFGKLHISPERYTQFVHDAKKVNSTCLAAQHRPHHLEAVKFLARAHVASTVMIRS